MSRCSHPLCTSRHSGKYRIAELCPLAQEKRRASWRAYEDHLHQAHLRTYAERFGEPGTETGLSTIGAWRVTKRIKIRNPAVTLDMRLSKRRLYKYLWALRKRALEATQRLAELASEGVSRAACRKEGWRGEQEIWAPRINPRFSRTGCKSLRHEIGGRES
jgi:hypothetical protein